MKKFLLLLALMAINSGGCKARTSGDGETFGEERPDASGTVQEISEQFGHNELQKLYQLLNSEQFQAPLTNYHILLYC